MKKVKVLDLAAFFAEYEVRMKKMNRPKIAEFCIMAALFVFQWVASAKAAFFIL